MVGEVRRIEGCVRGLGRVKKDLAEDLRWEGVD